MNDVKRYRGYAENWRRQAAGDSVPTKIAAALEVARLMDKAAALAAAIEDQIALYNNPQGGMPWNPETPRG